MLLEEKGTILYRSGLAGIFIGLGALLYTRCENLYIGAFLFSFGLLCVLNFNALLFTGKIGYFDFHSTNMLEQIFRNAIMLFYNIIGILLVAAVSFDHSSMIFMTKLSHSMVHTFFSSVFCGIMMYLAVDLWKKTKTPLYVIMAIMIFIIAGFDHCIANFYYFGINAYPAIQWRTLLFFLVNITGNAIGSIGINALINLK